MQEMQVQPLGREDSLEKEMAICSSILAWEIPWTEEPGGQQSMGWHKSWTQLSDYSQPVSSVAQSCPALCDPMNRSPPGLPVHHQLPEFTQTHAHRVGDAAATSCT